MSDISQELLVPRITRKRVISVIIVTGILLSIFAFSTFLFSMLMGSQRITPSEQLDDAEMEDLELILPPLPWDLEELLSDLTPEELAELQNMLDGDISDYDLAMMGAAIAALLASEIEVFRVYNYDSFASMSDKLWRYECFDNFIGTGWESTAIKASTSFFPYDDYYADYSSLDLLRIQMPINAPSIGASSFVIPSEFPTPFIMEGSVDCPNIDDGATILYKDELNCSTLDVSFTSEEISALSYELFGLDLPTSEEINNSAVDESYTSTEIKNRYLQLPPNIPAYISGNSFFQKHYSVLNSIIKPSDNAFMVANKIRNYLQDNFTIGINALLNDGPANGEDVVYWFCEHEEGIWSDFASAFCAFARAFGVAARFVDGFNSVGIVEEDDNGQNTFLIKYKNIYNWAEIYVPTDTSGNGLWIQMDCLYDSYGGGNPIPEDQFYLNIYSNFTAGYRNQLANITAHLSSPTASAANRKISFIDLTTNTPLGDDYTNDNGDASILIPIGASQVVGPHIIQGSYFTTLNATGYVVYGPIQVELRDVNPQNVNRTNTNNTIVEGRVTDPWNGQRVKNATVEFVLLQKATQMRVFNPFTPGYTNTNNTGEFRVNLTVNPSVVLGQYQIRIDFNGSWNFVPLAVGIMSASSSRADLNVTELIVKKIYFYINNILSSDAYNPVVSRGSNLMLKVLVLDKNNVPLQNEIIEFRDVTLDMPIGVNSTNASGIATYSYNVGFSSISGPNLLVARVDNLRNYSYFILNEKPTIYINSGPTPLEINRTGSGTTQFRVIGTINDTTNNKGIGFSLITLKLLKNGFDNSSYLLPNQAYPFTADKNGKFDFSFRVASYTPPGNYNLRIDFNGTFNLLSNIYYSFWYNLPYINTSTYLTNQLKISAPEIFIFNLYINDMPTDGPTFTIYRNDDINLSAYIICGGLPIADGEFVEFYDLTENTLLGSSPTSAGHANLIYSTDSSTVAGPHLIRARWSNKYNYSYYILDAPIFIDLNLGPMPNTVNRSSSIGRTFVMRGFLNDSINGKPIKYGEISVHLFDGPAEVTYLISRVGGSLQLNATGEIFLIFYISSSATTKNYTLQLWFNGTFLYSLPNNQYNQHNFFLPTTVNFTDVTPGLQQLKVVDPYDIDIYLYINGSSALLNYGDGNPPRRFNRGETMNFTVIVKQYGNPVNTGMVRIYDVYEDSFLVSYTYVGGENGLHAFLIDSSSWHAGLHQVKVNWSSYDSYNSTYVIINETVNIFANLNKFSVQRNVETFQVSGYVEESGINLRGLRVKIVLLNNIGIDVSGYLSVSAGVNQTINNDGTFIFYVFSISLSCPNGKYFIRIDFNGSIDAPGILLTNYMVYNSSELIIFNVTAGVTIFNAYYDTKVVKDSWYYGDTLYVYGNLSWDNGTLMNNMQVNATVKNGIGTILTSGIISTNAYGFFNISIPVGSWPSNTEIFVYFFPEVNFASPNYYYVEMLEQEVFRQL